ncbi:MAG TPA: hypothetical protein EYO33_23820 [Phycisphaerales bacterium]|nr:hypothetical protein [Phycisphaerales bacterium]
MLESPSPHRDIEVMLKAYRILVNNRFTVKTPQGTTHTFTTPSLTDGAGNSHLDYGGKQWLWDSAAHIMNLAHTEPEVAKLEFRALLAHQTLDAENPDHGFVPHMNYFHGDGRKVPEWVKAHYARFLDREGFTLVGEEERDDFCSTYWSHDYHSDITQPPLLAMAALELYEVDQDKGFLAEIFPALVHYYDYLSRRRADSDGLVRIIHPWESGWDNSQRWDEAIGLGRQTGPLERSRIDHRKMALFSKWKALHWNLDAIFASGDFSVKPVDFNVLYVKNLECLAILAEELQAKSQAGQLKTLAATVRETIFEKMWDGDKYADLISGSGPEQLSPVKSAAMFYPMMLDNEPHSEHLLKKHLANPEEFCPPGGFLVPTTSLDDPSTPQSLLPDPNDHYWRGNVWVIVNFFVRCAVEHYLKRNPGDALAQRLSFQIRESTFELLHKQDFFEYFHPLAETRGFGVPSFGWNGLAVFMKTTPAFQTMSVKESQE